MSAEIREANDTEMDNMQKCFSAAVEAASEFENVHPLSVVLSFYQYSGNTLRSLDKDVYRNLIAEIADYLDGKHTMEVANRKRREIFDQFTSVLLRQGSDLH